MLKTSRLIIISLQSEEFKTGMDTRSPQGDTAKVLKKMANAQPQNKKSIQKLHTPKGVVYGAKLPDGTIYINPDNLNCTYFYNSKGGIALLLGEGAYGLYVHKSL